ncbi:MAG: CNP1-like family protein [Methyloversatilis sp.]|uniref:CNP1-like family protein n=1 Tax=Methyloversatilis sp. TaxID=2569862 RepID=UPI002732F4D6|nr:CNP1-like family protein [Methyloversatilis sp.]MDP3873861.1 CNP1-like family protein [Methyloversatilis sp.]
MLTKNALGAVRCAAAVMLCLSITGAGAQITDWQKPEPYRGQEAGEPGELKEDDFALPDVRQATDWVEFHVGSETRNRYFVARASISVGKDEVTRFISRVLTAGGAETVSVEGIRCATAERRLYAHLRTGAGWVSPRAVQWSPVYTGNRFNAYHYALFDGLICSGDRPQKPSQTIELMAASFKSRVGTPLTGYR